MKKHSVLYHKIQKQFIENWRNCPEYFPDTGKRFSYLDKRIWESQFDRFISFLQAESKMQEPNKTEIRQQCDLFFKKNLSFTSKELVFIFSEEMIHATKIFIQNAWQFDPDLSNEELFQALRNVWIMLGLQSFFGVKIQITASLLAYSLLYPYTDNLLDDASVDSQKKLKFCLRLALRLAGKKVESESILESQIYRLVSKIESEFNREKYPEVYQSLLAIHNAQTKSLQLLGKNSFLPEEEIFQICIKKGANSVIADGYLVLGDLDEKQFHFLYEYGAYLQILDDLQDARQDYLDGVMTCFSRQLPSENLDNLLCKTCHLGKKFHQTLKDLYPNKNSFHGLIKRSFGLLLIASIFENQEDFSPELIRKVEKQTPFRFSFLHKRETELKALKDVFLKKREEYRMKNCVQKN
jgi:hypothetical protein